MTTAKTPKTPTRNINPDGDNRKTTTAKTAKTQPLRLPDPPDREPDDMTSFDHLAATSIIEPLRHHLGHPETTLITGEKYLCHTITQNLTGARYPDLLIAFHANLETYRRDNGYSIANQGKPPDFVLEIASRRTGRTDTGPKRRAYANFGVTEYWRFDQTGQHHRTRLAADRLTANHQYRPIPIHPTPEGALQGYSPTLNLHLAWQDGQLIWLDPQTNQPIPTFTTERQSRLSERQAREQAEARAQAESARARQLEAELRRLRGE